VLHGSKLSRDFETYQSLKMVSSKLKTSISNHLTQIADLRFAIGNLQFFDIPIANRQSRLD